MTVNPPTGNDPNITYTVKELIGRLEGKIDAFIDILTKKADREDVDALRRHVDATNQRVSIVEDTVKVIQALATAQATAEAAKETAIEKVRGAGVSRNRWVVGTLLLTIGLVVSMLTLLITFHSQAH